MADKWIQAAITHHGVFRKAAEKAGMSTEAYAHKHQHAPGVLGHRARLALTLMHLHGHSEASKPKPKSDMDEFREDVGHAMKHHMKHRK